MTDTRNDVAKAFLSHSSLDKSFVEAVAKRLGRVQVFFDKWGFETGDAFAEAIPEALSSTDCFVLFASKASLASFWVTFEARHARKLIASNAIRQAIVLIVDDKVSIDHLPKWMKKSLISKVTSAATAARIIQHRLNQLRGVDQKDYFYGRDALMSEFAPKLAPRNGGKPPHIIVAGGLSGIGRKTFVRRALETRLALRFGPVFQLQRTDGIDALHLALLTELDELQSKSELSTALALFAAMTPLERAEELVHLLGSFASFNTAPCIVDAGAFLLSDGTYTPEALELWAQLSARPDITLVLILPRLPFMVSDDLERLGMCTVRVAQLSPESTRELLERKLADLNVSARPEQVEGLIPFLSGYPPAIALAATYAREYGLDTLLLDTSTLTNFQQQTFAEVLQLLRLSDYEWGILRLLAAGLSLSIEGMLAATQQESTNILPAVRRLVDLNLVLQENGIFAIAYPIRYAVQSVKGVILPSEFSFLSANLKRAFWDGRDELPTYETINATISALLRSDDPNLHDFRGFVVPSMLFRAASDLYQLSGHDNWIRSRDLVETLLELNSNHPGGLVLLTKIQVRLQTWSNAQETLQKVQNRRLPERYFLEGFLFWKQRKFQQAVGPLKTALRIGQKAVEIYHALAICLFRLDRSDEAKKYIKDALQDRPRGHVLLIDLAAQIAISSGDLEDAAIYVEQLRRLNAKSDYHHRAATMHLAKREAAEALPHARLALDSPRQRFEVETTLINVLIETRDFVEAEERLDVLDRTYAKEQGRRDVRLGLRAKLSLRRGLWKEAEQLWDNLEDKESPVHQAIRKEILEQKAADTRASKTDRQQARLALEALAQSLPALEVSNSFLVE